MKPNQLFSHFILVNLILIPIFAFAEPQNLKETSKKVIQEAKSAESFSLEAQFNGPFKDTLIQRWVDDVKGNVCYLYIPVILPERIPFINPNNPNNQQNQAQNLNPNKIKIYGANNIGSISCVKR